MPTPRPRREGEIKGKRIKDFDVDWIVLQRRHDRLRSIFKLKERESNEGGVLLNLDGLDGEIYDDTNRTLTTRDDAAEVKGAFTFFEVFDVRRNHIPESVAS
jgi:hypothetical protein